MVAPQPALLKQSPAQIEEFILQNWSDEKMLYDDFNRWLLIAQVTRSRAISLDKDIDLAWAKVALMVYERLATKSTSSLFDVMWLKAALIKKLGEHQPLGNIKEIVDWFFGSLPYTYEETMQKISIAKTGLKNLPIDEIRELRHIKRRLNILQFLENLVADNQALEKWLKIREQLP